MPFLQIQSPRFGPFLRYSTFRLQTDLKSAFGASELPHSSITRLRTQAEVLGCELCSLLHLALPLVLDLNGDFGDSVVLDGRVLVEDGLVDAAAGGDVDEDDDVACALTDVLQVVVRVLGHSLGPGLFLSGHLLGEVDG